MFNDKYISSSYYLLDNIFDYFKHYYDIDINMNILNVLVNNHLLTVIYENNIRYVFESDLKVVLPILLCNKDNDLIDWQYFWRNLPLNIKLNANTELININLDAQIDQTFYSAIKNLFNKSYSICDDKLIPTKIIPYFLPTKICTSSDSVFHFISDQLSRYQIIQSSNSNQFASSAYYMGSKRLLRGFLAEAISSVLPKGGVVLDLMCGSGAASGAFSKIWKTYASDAQQFCQKLAIIQGGGFSVRDANRVIEDVLPLARNHFTQLSEKVIHFLNIEDNIFHSDINQDAIIEYIDFMKNFPTYPDGKQYYGWDPIAEINQRKLDPLMRPYCLFTAYFANQYFGLRQCIEIDSLRFAIGNIDDKKAQDWAFGALIASLSARGTTYGGHFAQPKKIDYDNIYSFLEIRSQSVIYEFCVRLLALSEESEQSSYEIEIIPGPWLNSLSAFEQLNSGAPVVVYLDAPYTREEYSRYYHVLETLISYSYPSCRGIGKIPDKRRGERFDSEFFTRNKFNFTKKLSQVIFEILNRGWVCAWSYAEPGGVSIIDVVNKVNESIHCNICTYSTPHQHKSQGGRKSKNVTEYLILFIP
jgi:adenine-specific DNA-methyltransferase